VKFEWDSRKASSNLRKHSVSFAEAVTVFQDPLALIFDDELHSYKEHREIIIGYSVLNRLIFVCFSERDENTLRIISARLPTRNERKDYEENTGK
jgi:uncharacterized protein